MKFSREQSEALLAVIEAGIAHKLDRDNITFWTIKDVLKGQGISRSLWYDQVRMGVAPKPVKTGERRIAWLKSEVLAHRQKLVEDRDKSSSGRGAAYSACKLCNAKEHFHKLCTEGE